MSSVLNNKVVAALNKGHTSAYYNSDKTNPVLQSLEQDTRQFIAYMKKRSAPGYKAPDGESSSRPADMLFELWNKYERKLSKLFYQEKLLEMGDFLTSLGEYKLALWQCYDRYLQDYGDINMEEMTSVDKFKESFFPNGFDAVNVGFTFRALMGKSISMYQVVRRSDPKLQNRQSVQNCFNILEFLRLVMQVVLPQESLCWLVFNGTVHIYTICLHLMSIGHSVRVLEFLLWAAVCMETSVPLMTVRYLTWRATLYTAVCQCYYDCKAGQHAEAFARRGLTKISELSQLESLSNAIETPESVLAFRQATVRMAVMIYKRSVFETRRKPKGLLRPKTRSNYKDVMNDDGKNISSNSKISTTSLVKKPIKTDQTAWPRTLTEKMLVDMFEGGAAQFLAILEALSDSNRRILLASPPAPDNEPEILDVYLEQFMAAQELLAGRGVNRAKLQSGTGVLSVVIEDGSLIDMAARGEDYIPLESVIQLAKMAFNYEHYDIFDTLVEPILTRIKNAKNRGFSWDRKALELLQALSMGRPSPARKIVKRLTIQEEKIEFVPTVLPQGPPPSNAADLVTMIPKDDVVNLTEILLSIVKGPFQQDEVDLDMVIDLTLNLWSKCKVVFQKFQTGSMDNPRYLQKMDQVFKWMYVLDSIHCALGWTGLSSVDPIMTSEVVLRLAMMYEGYALLETMDEATRLGLKESKTMLTEEETCKANMESSITNMLTPQSKQVILNLLSQARNILETGLENVNYARHIVAVNDGKSSIADVGWIKELYPEVFQDVLMHKIEVEKVSSQKTESANTAEDQSSVNPNEQIPASLQGCASTNWNTVKDLHLELILMYHRVTLKMAAISDTASCQKSKKSKEKLQPKSQKKAQGGCPESFQELVDHCRCNLLSKALLFAQQALTLGVDGSPTEEQKKLLESAVECIQKAQAEERRIYYENFGVSDRPPVEALVPPPPILLSRTSHTMVFCPAPFKPASGHKVAWYRLFCRNAAGSNVKARLGDYFFPGTGDEIPSYSRELKVSGLTPNERYVFALAAYAADGTLIGGSIGETTKPILAFHPLPVLTTWAFLSQIAYQVGHFAVALQASEALWEHFLAPVPRPDSGTYITRNKKNVKFTLHKLNRQAVCLSSPVLLRQFLLSIFINVDINVRQKQLFCDILCDQGPLYSGQIKRLAECEKMLVAIELAGWLNEASLALQAVVQCYGLLAPLIYYKIPSLPVIQILQQCHAVLQEVQPILIQKRQGHVTDSLLHMTACITYHLAKVLRTWGQKKLANTINETGRKLLSLEEVPDISQEIDKTELDEETDSDGGSLNIAALKKKKTRDVSGTDKKKIGSVSKDNDEVNRELRALQAHMMNVSNAAQGEHELSGNEDFSILHAYIAYLPSKLAFKEVSKFKKRTRYLEFFVQVAQKGLTEGEMEQVKQWCEEMTVWLQRRNEAVTGPSPFVTKLVGGAVTIAGDDPKTFAAAMVEYNKRDTNYRFDSRDFPEVEGIRSGNKPKIAKKGKYKPLLVTPLMSEAARKAQEEKEVKGLEILDLLLLENYHKSFRRKRLRKILIEELPWQCQLNMIQALSHFGAWLQKLEKREKLFGFASSNLYKTSYLDPEWFTFETAGTLIVGCEFAPSHGPPSPGKPQKKKSDAMSYLVNALDLATDERPKTTGIEFAAAVATGRPPAPLYPIPPEVEDTPRTYRSDTSKKPSKIVEPEYSPVSTKATYHSLNLTFGYFKRAVVLAHRGQYWTLLQNSARALWNCLHTAMQRAVTLAPEGQDQPGLLTVARLNEVVWHPVHMATDCLLDMLFLLESEQKQYTIKTKSKGRQNGNLFQSWFGSITEERGGSSLRFEMPLDEISTVNVRWVRRLVLRCLELLYYQQKWEKLVDIALRFSVLSNDRYAEQIVPLLVQAQRQIATRIKSVDGPPIPQPHHQTLVSQLGHLITARDYMTAQLKVQLDPERVKLIKPGTQIDPQGHNAYTQKDAFRLSCVPLDTSLSLQVLRNTLEKSRYTARALQHSRKLLILYFAGQQNCSESANSRQSTKVDFVPSTACPQPTTPPDLKNDEFLSQDDVRMMPIPRSQISQVIISYEKTIELLLAKNQKGLAAQAMQELGNIHYHMDNIRAAYQFWAEALDIVLGMTDALHIWRKETQACDDVCRFLLDRCGLWGCVMGGVLASNIAQYILTADLGQRMECCFLSGYLFKALFRASLPHPVSDYDYALYEVGEGCEVTNLVPGVDFLSEHFRCNSRSLVAGLRWVTEEMARGKHSLFVLPLLTLYQHFTTYVCRDVQRCVDGRILKVRVLTELGLFSEAITVLQRLLYGERLPYTGDSSFRQVESQLIAQRFNTSLPIDDVSNLKVLENLLDKRVSSNLAMLFGPHLTCHLSLAQSHLFVALADTLPVLPNIDPAPVRECATGLPDIGMPPVSVSPFGGPSTKQRKTSFQKKSAKDRKDVDIDEAIAPTYTNRFTERSEPLTLEIIKGTLLSVADQMVTTMSEVICENASNEKAGVSGLAAAELELVVLCRLEQAAIAEQKHHAPMAARSALSALRFLQDSCIFKPKKPTPPVPRDEESDRPSSLKGNSSIRKAGSSEVRLVTVESNQFQYHNFQSRARLDIRLWLTCRLALVSALNKEIRGMGEVKGPEHKVLRELAECRQYCSEGMKEAETCGDKEVHAEFLTQGALLNIMEGRRLEQTITLLDDAIQLLRSMPCPSVPGEELLAKCIILRTDLEAAIASDARSNKMTQQFLEAYLQAQDIILHQMETLGESIEHNLPAGKLKHRSVPVTPLQNIYTIQVLRLAQLKLRIGHAMSRSLVKEISSGQKAAGSAERWEECLRVFNAGLQIMKCAVRREVSTEAEILLSKGKVEKMLMYLGKYQPNMVAETLLIAIRTSLASNHDLGLIHQAYLELALIFLISSGMVRVRDGSILEPVLPDTGEELSSQPAAVKDKKRAKQVMKKSLKEEETQTEKERRAAWVAIRCATITAEAQRARGMLIGDTNITAEKVSLKSDSCPVPDFAVLDMVHSYVLGEKKKVFKNEIEEELAPLVEAQEVKVAETYEDQMKNVRNASSDLSWIHFLGYQTILKRLCCTATISISSLPSTGEVQIDAEEVGGANDFDLGFISRAQFDMGQNFDVVRNMLFAGHWCIRLNHLHRFLCANLPSYADCCAAYPPASLLNLIFPQEARSKRKSTSVFFGTDSLGVFDPSQMKMKSNTSAQESSDSVFKSQRLSDSQIADCEVAVQWFQSSLVEMDPKMPEINPADRHIILLYATSQKLLQSSINPGLLWVSLHKVINLHDRLSVLAQEAEILSVDKDKEAQASLPASKAKKTQRNKELAPKVQLNEQLQSFLRQCMDDCSLLLGSEVETSGVIPFEITNTNLKNLEQLFDPSLGMLLQGTDLVQWIYKMFPSQAGSVQ